MDGSRYCYFSREYIGKHKNKDRARHKFNNRGLSRLQVLHQGLANQFFTLAAINNIKKIRESIIKKPDIRPKSI